MARHWEDPEQLKAQIPREGMIGHVCWLLGPVFAILGVIGDATNRTLGLEPTSWFLLAIVAFVAAIVPFVEMAIAWYLNTRN